MKTLRILFFMGAIAISVAPLSAQKEEEPREMGGASLELGYGNFPVSQIGDFASDDLVPSPEFFLFGLNSQVSRNRLVLKYTLSYALNQNTRNDSLSLSFFAGNFSLGGGYMLVDQKQFKLYPLVAPGFNFTHTSISEDGNLGLQEVMEDPGREINLYRLGFLLDFSLNLDFITSWKYDEEREEYSGFMTGLRVGYLLDFENDNWHYQGGKVSGAPAYGMQGFYVKMTVGFAGANKL